MGSMENGTIRYAAFLKGINVGGHTVKMDRLRELFGEMRAAGETLDAVETYIASGNVVFSAASSDERRLEAAIAAHLDTVLGYRVPVFVRTLDELARIAAYRPFPGPSFTAEGSSLYIAFLPGPPDAGTAKRIEAASSSEDRFKVHRGEIYWLCATRFSESPFSGPALERLIGLETTVRKSTTVKKMADRFGI